MSDEPDTDTLLKALSPDDKLAIKQAVQSLIGVFRPMQMPENLPPRQPGRGPQR